MLSFLLSKNPSKYWLQTLVILAIIMVCVLLYKRQNLSPYYEGFTQDSKFVMKQNNDIYDDFYVEIYDKLMEPGKRCDYEIEKIIEMTGPSTKHSIFLEIGSGTGHLINHLHRAGYSVFGLDRSQAMVNHVEKIFPDVQVKCGDVSEPMMYDRGTFSHVLCTGMTIYQLPNKNQFFKNCYFWLRPGGYLVINLVNRDKFDTIVPGGRPPLLSSPQQYAKTRIKDTIIDFVDFEYKGSYKFGESGDKRMATFKETFTDELSKNVRQNEITLYMDDMDAILRMAAQCGFLVKGQADLLKCTGDEHQYLCVLERPQ